MKSNNKIPSEVKKLMKLINDTFDLDDVRERGVYPIFRAKETTFSLNAADSMKDSLTTMFALNELM